MRERCLEAFDTIRIDCLNGDKHKTGKAAPDGSPDPSVFSTEGDPVGIQVGAAITTLVRKAGHAPAEAVGFRHPWGRTKLKARLADYFDPAPSHEEIARRYPTAMRNTTSVQRTRAHTGNGKPSRRLTAPAGHG